MQNTTRKEKLNQEKDVLEEKLLKHLFKDKITSKNKKYWTLKNITVKDKE